VFAEVEVFTSTSLTRLNWSTSIPIPDNTFVAMSAASASPSCPASASWRVPASAAVDSSADSPACDRNSSALPACLAEKVEAFPAEIAACSKACIVSSVASTFAAAEVIASSNEAAAPIDFAPSAPAMVTPAAAPAAPSAPTVLAARLIPERTARSPFSKPDASAVIVASNVPILVAISPPFRVRARRYEIRSTRKTR